MRSKAKKGGRQASPDATSRTQATDPSRSVENEEDAGLKSNDPKVRLQAIRDKQAGQAGGLRAGLANPQPQFLSDDHQVNHLRKLHNKTMNDENPQESEEEDISAQQPVEHVVQTDLEKSGFLATLNDMRKKTTTTPGFSCDVSFAVRGRIFPAHKFVVGGCSRWLRSLLAEGDEEVINLDMIRDEASFEAVLNYMYGEACTLEVATIEGILQVSRRLELVSLEQKCWSFLLLSVNEDNCTQLHELADRYGCTPLKLASWRVIQQNVPGYALSPAQLLSSMQPNKDGSPQKPGRMKDGSSVGPGSKHTSVSRAPRYDAADGVFEDEDEDTYPSIFQSFVSNDEGAGGGKDGVESTFFHHFFSEGFFDGYTAPEKLDVDVAASQVLKSWATKLQLTWMECHPEIRGVNDPYKFYYEGTAAEEQADELRTFLSGLSENELEVVRRRCDEILNPAAAKSKKGLNSAARMPVITIDYRERLIEFYSLYKPENLDKIEDILSKWAGTEDDMLVKLYVKYEKPMPPELKIDICCHQYLMQLQARQQDQLSTIMAANSSGGIDYNVQGDKRKKVMKAVRQPALKKKQDEDDDDEGGEQEGDDGADEDFPPPPQIKDVNDDDEEEYMPPQSVPTPTGGRAGQAERGYVTQTSSEMSKSRTRTTPRLRGQNNK